MGGKRTLDREANIGDQTLNGFWKNSRSFGIAKIGSPPTFGRSMATRCMNCICHMPQPSPDHLFAVRLDLAISYIHISMFIWNDYQPLTQP